MSFIRLDAGLAMKSEIQQKLTVSESEVYRSALNYWENKPHQSLSISLQQLSAILGGGKKSPGSQEGADSSRPINRVNSTQYAERWVTGDHMTQGVAYENPDRMVHTEAEAEEPETHFLEEDFVLLTPEELKSLDPAEQVGIVMGPCLFIASDTPRECIPLVVTNLAMLRRMSEDSQMVSFFNKLGITVEVSQHWTANIIDLILAEAQFGKDHQKFLQYLQWRKKLERTDFFHNEAVSEVLQNKIRTLTYRRTTHPLHRGRYTRDSWQISGTLQSLGRDSFIKMRGMVNVSRVDSIFRQISGRSDFHPEFMMCLMRLICERCQNEKNMEKVDVYQDSITGIAEKRRVNRYVLRLDDWSLIQQADLLTKQVLLDQDFLLTQTKDNGAYIISNHALKTAEAFIDRLAYFARAWFDRLNTTTDATGMGSTLLKLMKTSCQVVIPIAEKFTVNITVSEETAYRQEMDRISLKIKELERAIAQIDELYGNLRKSQNELSAMVNIEYLPGSLESDMKVLGERRLELSALLDELCKAASVIEQLKNARDKSRHLLASIVEL